MRALPRLGAAEATFTSSRHAAILQWRCARSAVAVMPQLISSRSRSKIVLGKLLARIELVAVDVVLASWLPASSWSRSVTAPHRAGRGHGRRGPRARSARRRCSPLASYGALSPLASRPNATICALRGSRRGLRQVVS